MKFIAVFLSLNFSAFSQIDSLTHFFANTTGRERANLISRICDLYSSTNVDSALKYCGIGLQFSKKEGLNLFEADFYNHFGNIYVQKGEYGQALKNYIQSERIYNDEKQINGKIKVIMNIGYVYELQNLYDKSLQQYESACSLSSDNNNKDYLAQALGHLGSQCYAQANKIKSLEYFKKALETNQQINNIPRIMECLNNIAVIYQEMGKYPEALQNFNTDLEYARKMSIKTDIIAILHNIGLVYKDKKDYSSAISYIDSSIYIAKEIRDFNNLREAYSTLSEIYKEQNNYIKALEFFQLSSAAKDSLLSQTREKQFIEMSTKYETEKKESENKLLKSEGEKQKAILIAITGGFILMLLLAFFVYRGYRQKKKANVLLAAHNKEIKIQKQIIEEKQTEILDSITYAKRLQDAILPPVSLLERHLNVFVYYQPKDIVAGDFYWMETVAAPADCILIAAADCTGHGVPGAMVSVVCSNALNRAVHEYNLTDPGQILDKTRELVLMTFAKSERNVRDGMDISLCAIHRNQDNIVMKWAGANNPVYIISNSRLNEVKGDKFHVGAFVDDKQNNFKTHSIELLKGDRIFIFSDGLPDQFGGPNNKKYKYKRLQEKLLESNTLGIAQQRRFMENDLLAWKGTHEQVDDILLIGFEV
jgi:serine phosphatase RsbU (regulator of sigma subunit)